MLYNKNNVRKTNDKKILHKVGKQWKVVSVALLMAIGGTAVATHAANAQSNNNLDQVPAVQSYVNVKPASASNQSASSSASSVAPVHYLSNNGGSAASYRANASDTMNSVNSASALVSGYVQSLNARMPEVANTLNTQIASATSTENSDNSMANSYSVAANAPANQAKVSSLAMNAGYTNANDYVKYAVSTSANNLMNSASDAVNYSNAINVLSNVAQSLMVVNWGNAKSNASSEVKNIAVNSSIVSYKNSAAMSYSNMVNPRFSSASAALSTYNSDLASASMKADVDRAVNNASDLNSDNSVMNSANTAIAKANGQYVALSTLSSKANSASAKAFKASSALNDASSAANYVTNFTSKMASGMSNSSNFVSSLAADYKTGKRASVESALGLSGVNNANMVTKGLMASMLSNDGINVASLYDLYQNKSLFGAMKAVASNASASMSGKSLTPANLFSVGNAMASIANSNVASTASNVASYTVNNSAALNSVYANRYSSAAQSASVAVSNLIAEANAGYSKLLGSNATSFDNAVALVNNAKSVAAQYNTLANEYAKNVWLNAPKFITITKNGLLHKSYNYGDANDAKLAKVEAGQQYQVLAYRIAANGALRYEIQVGNKTGYFTSANGYVESTYAFANVGNNYTVKVNKDVRVFKDENRTQATGDILKAGTPLNVIAVGAGNDDYYGGYSVYEIMDGQYAGKFITSNVKVVSQPQSNSNNTGTNNNNESYGVKPSINF